MEDWAFYLSMAAVSLVVGVAAGFLLPFCF